MRMTPVLAVHRLWNWPPLGTSVPLGFITLRASEPTQRMVEHVVEDDVVPLIALGEVFLRVVDDVVGADRSDQGHLGGAAHAGHFRAERLGDLHGERCLLYTSD